MTWFSEGLTDDHLFGIGLVAQTTLLESHVKSEFGRLIMSTSGLRLPLNLKTLSPVCNATQLRQDAIRELAQDVDYVIVVGGHNSSNTGNLARIAGENGAVYHILSADDVERLTITHQPVGTTDTITSSTWLTEGDRIGITSGASTPKESTDEVIERIIHLANI